MAIRAIARRPAATPGVEQAPIGVAIVAWLLALIGFFPVLSKSATELVVGADDRHLDFRVTIQLRADAANGRELVAGTVVHCHNRLGRIYLATTSRDRSGQFETGGKSNEELSMLWWS